MHTKCSRGGDGGSRGVEGQVRKDVGAGNIKERREEYLGGF